jgi:hypothetical protein
MKEMKGSPDTDPLSLFRQPAEVRTIDPQAMANKEAENRVKEKTAVTPEVKVEALAPTFFDEAPTAPTKEVTPEADSVPLEEDAVENPNAEDFKKLRAKLKETKKTAKELEEKYLEAENKVKAYVPPDVLREKEAKIEELSRYEKLHNLKSSHEYKEKYVEPISKKHDALKTLLKDYGVPEEEVQNVVKHAVNISNTAQLNAFLSDHFADQLGAKEAKDLISGIRTIEAEARAAEAEPERVLQSLQEEMESQTRQREAARRDTVTRTARGSWEEAVLEIQREGAVKELIYRDEDPEFNQNYPEKLLKQAASEYGKLITEMAKDGATPSKVVAKALARMTLLSQTAGVAIVTRNRAMEEAEAVKTNAIRTNGLFRPPIGGGTGNGAMPTGTARERSANPEKDLRADAAGLLNQVLQKR